MCYAQTVSDRDPVDDELIQGYSQLLSLAVHEFRTPTSVVGGYLRMLQRDTDSTLSDRQRKMIEEAEKGGVLRPGCRRQVPVSVALGRRVRLRRAGAAMEPRSWSIIDI